MHAQKEAVNTKSFGGQPQLQSLLVCNVLPTCVWRPRVCRRGVRVRDERDTHYRRAAYCALIGCNTLLARVW